MPRAGNTPRNAAAITANFPWNSKPARTALLACFFFSGAAGLIDEVAWTKSLGLVFGHSAYASATVLAVFMGGLAAGSAWIGSKSDHIARPIAFYGRIELGIAATGGFSLAGLSGLQWLYSQLFPAISGSGVMQLALRFAGAAVVLFIPCFLMGGTLPLLVRGFLRNPSSAEEASHAQFGRSVSRLYGVNTLGAVVGATTAGFVLLPEMGSRLSITFAAILNAAVGLLALQLSRRLEASVSSPSAFEIQKLEASKHNAPLAEPALRGVLLAAFALVGGTAMCYEIAWARLLATLVGSSSYAFTLMLATFLAGIALGSIVHERWVAHRAPSLEAFAHTQTLTAITALLFLVFFRELPDVVPTILRVTHESFGGLVATWFFMAALTMLPTAIVFGFNFPGVVSLIAKSPGEEERFGRAVGRAYAANTCGAIVASLFAGFFLISWLGSFRVVALAAMTNLFLAVALGRLCKPRRNALLLVNAVLFACVSIAAWSPYFYDRALASFNVVLYWKYHEPSLTLKEAVNTEETVFFEDGLNATISVARRDSYYALKTNGKVDASNVDASTQILLGDLGAIFHPNPQRVLVIGFGGGMTASAVSRFPEVNRIDCIEIEPAVLHAASYLEPLNRGVLHDPRLHLILDDARNVLLSSREQYDLIISEPSNPWIAGIATLFTDEYYAATRRRLAPGGIFVQWIQGYGLETEDFRIILASLAPHFANVTLWHSAGADFLVLARTGTEPLDFDRSRALSSDPQLREDFETLHLKRPEGWPAYFRLSDAEIRALAAGSPVNTDDRTLLEYRAPHSLIGKDRTPELESAVKVVQKGLLPAELRTTEARRALEAAAECSLDLQSSAAPDYVHALDAETATASLEVLRGRLALREHRTAEAIAHLNNAISIDPQGLDARYWLALAEDAAKSVPERDALLAYIFAHDSKNLRALSARIEFTKERGDWRAAAQAQAEYIGAMKEPLASDFCRLGDLWARTGDFTSAVPALQRGIEHEPYSYLCHRDLGEIDRVQGRLSSAREHLEFVVRFYPDADPRTYISLALVSRAQGSSRLAREVLAKGRRIFPRDPVISRMSSR